MTGIGIPFPL